MSLAWRQLKAYVRLALVVIVVLAIALMLYNNRAKSVALWFFWLRDEQQPINVVFLMLWTAVGTLISWWVLSFGWELFRDMREIKRQSRLERAKKELTEREAELQRRERQLDEKVDRVIGNNRTDSET